jgi:hypothetical protein
MLKRYVKRIINSFKHQYINQKGERFINYCYKILLNNDNTVEPLDYEEVLFEKDIQNIMAETNCSRVESAAFIADDLLNYFVCKGDCATCKYDCKTL